MGSFKGLRARIAIARPIVAALAISSSQLDLSWAAVAGAIGYTLQVSTSQTFATLTQYDQVGLTKSLSGLTPRTTYYVRVSAMDLVGDVSEWGKAAATTRSASPTMFPVYDGTTFKPVSGKPADPLPGRAACLVVYSSELWDKGDNFAIPNLNKIRAKAVTWPTDRLVILDTETLRHKTLAECRQTAIYLQQIADVIREVAPDVTFAHYGCFPNNQQIYDPSLQPGGSRFIGQTTLLGAGNEWYSVWAACWECFRGVDVGDAMCQSFYTFYPNQHQWAAFATMHLDKADDVTEGLDQFPFLYWNFHDESGYIGDEAWMAEHVVLAPKCAGCVDWGGAQQPWGGNSDEGWYITSNEFIEEQQTP